jgi:hypothetical protein
VICTLCNEKGSLEPKLPRDTQAQGHVCRFS